MSVRSPDPESAGGQLDELPSVALLARVRGGDAAAREALLRRYWPRLERWAHGRLPAWARDLNDTGDLVQETLLAIARSGSRAASSTPDPLRSSR